MTDHPEPSIPILIGAVSELDDRVTDLAEAMRGSAQVTDAVLQRLEDALGEMSLQIAFLMQHIVMHETQNAGLAGPDGKVPTITKSAAQVYIERGRAKMFQQREQMQKQKAEERRAQGLPTAEAPPAGDTAAADAEARADADALKAAELAAPPGPKLVH